MGLEAGADGPAGLRLVVVKADADRREDRVAVVVDARHETGNGPCRLNLGDRESTSEISHGLRRDGSAQAAAHRAEPIQFLRAVEGRGYRPGIADGRTADRPRTNE